MPAPTPSVWLSSENPTTGNNEKRAAIVPAGKTGVAMRIVVAGEVTKSLISGFYLEHDDFCFPDKEWTDFSQVLICTWTRAMLARRHKNNVKFSLYFMDGPYQLDMYKDHEDLKVNCVSSGSRKDNSEFSFHCEYESFLSALYFAAESFGRLLLEKGSDIGEYKAAYDEISAKMKELEKAGKSRDK